jgi:hypothetical protein
MFVSACSGGHPAEWIVTDISQLGEGDRLPTHMKLTMGRLTYYVTGIHTRWLFKKFGNLC